MPGTSVNLRASLPAAFVGRFEPRGSTRRGFMLLEVTVSAVLLCSILVIINQAVVRLHRQTRFTDRQAIAQQALENLLEEFCHRPWSEISTAKVDVLTLPEWVSEKLPAARLIGVVALESDPTAAKRITLQLSWQNSPQVTTKPLTLTTWIYQRPEPQP